MHGSVILWVALYGCEIWSLTLSKDHRLRMKFELKGYEVTNEWIKLHSNGELIISRPFSNYNINISVETKILRWMGHATHMVEMTTGYKVLIWKSEGKRTI
jgi:hypothetical protein